MEGNIREVILTEGRIQKRVRELGALISADYEGSSPLLVGVLRGAILFVADLVRAMHIDLEVDFMAVSSYGSTTRSSGVVRILKDLDQDIRDRDVLIIEDILDTGLTLNYLIKNLQTRQPRSIEVCALLVKRGKQKVRLTPKYHGFEIPDEFVVGYGLDLNERYRNLPYVATLKKGVMQTEFP